MKSKIYLLRTGLSKNDKFIKTDYTIAECVDPLKSILLYQYESDLIFDDNLSVLRTPPFASETIEKGLEKCDTVLIETAPADPLADSKFDFFRVISVGRVNQTTAPATATYNIEVEYDYFVNNGINAELSGTFSRGHFPWDVYTTHVVDAGGIPRNRKVHELNPVPKDVTDENGRCDCLAVFTTGKMRVVQGEAAADDIEANPRSDGTGVFFIPLNNAPTEYRSELSFSGFYEEFFYKVINEKIFPLKSPDILGILPCKIRDLPVGWKSVEFADVRYGDNPVYSMSIFSHSQTDSGLLFAEREIYPPAFANIGGLVKNMNQQITISLWGADFPLSVQKMTNSPLLHGGKCTITYAIYYEGTFSVCAVIKYPGDIVEYQRAVCTTGMMSVKSDRYTEIMTTAPAQYYAGLLAGGIGGAGAVIGGFASGNYFGAVQGVASMASQTASIIDTRNAPDTVKGGSGYIERWEYGDHIITIDVIGHDVTGKVDGYAGVFPYIGKLVDLYPSTLNYFYNNYTSFRGSVTVSGNMSGNARQYISDAFSGGVRIFNTVTKCLAGVLTESITNEKDLSS